MDDQATRRPGRPLPAPFERQAHLDPDRPAVACGTDTPSYGELNAWSNRLAQQLIGAGPCGRPSRVDDIAAERLSLPLRMTPGAFADESIVDAMAAVIHAGSGDLHRVTLTSMGAAD
jgi:non-ribosomal peptide synthetase component F